jgi:hypothetical protein
MAPKGRSLSKPPRAGYEDLESPRFGATKDLLQEGSLAYPRLALNEDEAAHPVRDALKHACHPVQLGGPGQGRASL